MQKAGRSSETWWAWHWESEHDLGVVLASRADTWRSKQRAGFLAGSRVLFRPPATSVTVCLVVLGCPGALVRSQEVAAAGGLVVRSSAVWHALCARVLEGCSAGALEREALLSKCQHELGQTSETSAIQVQGHDGEPSPAQRQTAIRLLQHEIFQMRCFQGKSGQASTALRIRS